LQLRQLNHVLFISQTPIRLGVPVVMLPAPTKIDIETVYKNLSQLQLFTSTSLSEGNYWKIIFSVIQ
jgi:hypothetical protein